MDDFGLVYAAVIGLTSWVLHVGFHMLDMPLAALGSDIVSWHSPTLQRLDKARGLQTACQLEP